MTEYLKAYMAETERKLNCCRSKDELEKLMTEHRDKIAFMQHERIVHFLVTMMFAIVLSIFICAGVMMENIGLAILDVIIIVLLGFYIKHYFFLENTVQRMYKVYDEILKKTEETDE